MNKNKENFFNINFERFIGINTKEKIALIQLIQIQVKKLISENICLFSIHNAVKNNDSERVKFLFDINAKNSKGQTPLHVAIEKQASKEIVNNLFKKDVNVKKIYSTNHFLI